MGIHGIGDRTGSIQPFHIGRQHFQGIQHPFLPLVFHFIPHSPDKNAGPVSVPLHHGFHILLPFRLKIPAIQAPMPFLKETAVMTARPFIKTFLIHVKAKLIAQIQKFRTKGVVRRPYGITSHFL